MLRLPNGKNDQNVKMSMMLCCSGCYDIQDATMFWMNNIYNFLKWLLNVQDVKILYNIFFYK